MDRSVYLSWAALALAIMANVAANTSLKQAMISVSTDSDKSILLQVLAVPSFWIGLVFAGVLLLSYLVAIRNMPVGTAYAFTTSLAMVGISSSNTDFSALRSACQRLPVSPLWH